MRTLLLTLVLLLPVLTCAQGVVAFQNYSDSRLTTNDFQGNIGFTSGLNAYRIGLYVAPFGTVNESEFMLVGSTTNRDVPNAGRFSGGNPFVISNNVGDPIAFQVRSWSYFAGISYEDALSYSGPEIVFAGQSTIGRVTPGIGSGFTPDLFGSNPGQISGFTLVPTIPEPSTVALAVLGAGALWFATRRRRKSSGPKVPE